MNIFEKAVTSKKAVVKESLQERANRAALSVLELSKKLEEKRAEEQRLKDIENFQRMEKEKAEILEAIEKDEEVIINRAIEEGRKDEYKVNNLNEIPDTILTARYLDLITPFKISNPDCGVEPRRKYSPLMKFKLPKSVDFQQLTEDTLEALKVYGEWNYRLKDPNMLKKDLSYGGLGLTYNPRHLDGDTADVHEQVQGNHNPGTRHVRNPYSNHSVESMPLNKKNSHFDTLGFVYRTPASRYKSLGTFLDSFKRTMVRTAIRIIYSEHEGPVGDGRYAGVTWHKDEAMTCNLRINIPIITHPDYVLEQEDLAPRHLEAGYGYSWNTNISHRAYALTRTAPPRIHLMLGFSCWWDFDENAGTWTANKFAGNKHPLDMLYDWDIIEGIQFLEY
jgi:hypothetical protein